MYEAQIKAKKLRAIREEAGLTQEQLADILNINRHQYLYIEKNGNIKSHILIQLSEYFGRPVEDFIDLPETEDSVPTRLSDQKDAEATRRILTPEEVKLLENYSALSPEARLMLSGYIDALMLNGKSETE